MSRPHRILIPREYVQDGETKTAWTEIGAAWPARSGEGFNCILHALPTPTMDKNGNVVTRFSIFPPRTDDDRQQQAPPQRQPTQAEPLNDDIPPF